MQCDAVAGIAIVLTAGNLTLSYTYVSAHPYIYAVCVVALHGNLCVAVRRYLTNMLPPVDIFAMFACNCSLTHVWCLCCRLQPLLSNHCTHLALEHLCVESATGLTGSLVDEAHRRPDGASSCVIRIVCGLPSAGLRLLPGAQNTCT